MLSGFLTIFGSKNVRNFQSKKNDAKMADTIIGIGDLEMARDACFFAYRFRVCRFIRERSCPDYRMKLQTRPDDNLSGQKRTRKRQFFFVKRVFEKMF